MNNMSSQFESGKNPEIQKKITNYERHHKLPPRAFGLYSKQI